MIACLSHVTSCQNGKIEFIDNDLSISLLNRPTQKLDIGYVMYYRLYGFQTVNINEKKVSQKYKIMF